MFVRQFFGKMTGYVLGGVAVLHVLSFLVKGTSVEPVALVLVAITTFAAAYRSLHVGIFIAFTELFVGGHGHLLSAPVGGFAFSIRMALFAAVMLAFVIHVARGRVRPEIIPLRDTPWFLLAGSIVIGTGIGLLQNDAGRVFDDANSYVALAYVLPLLSIPWTQTRRYELLQVFAASVAWIIGLTLILFYLFTHLNGDLLHPIYTFFRDRRIAEITLLPFADSNYLFRVFLPAQLFAAAFLLLVFSSLMFVWRGERAPRAPWIMLGLTTAALVVGMSRSLAVGLFVAGVLVTEIALKTGIRQWQTYTKRLPMAVFVTSAALAGVVFLAFVPIPPRADLTEAAFYKTSGEGGGREAAVTSRWNLLEPMMEAIGKSPIVGSGFGTTVTFTTDDPRIRDQDATGVYTTYRFEWGYQDIWLKMGILGLVAFGCYLAMITRAAFFTAAEKPEHWLIYGLWGSIVLLFIAHIFTPYLNHPMGSVLMLFILPFLDFKGWEAYVFEKQEEKARKHQMAGLRAPSPVVDQ